MRVIDGAAELARGVVAEHAPGHIAAAGAAEHRAAVQRGVAVELAVVHVSGGALQMAHLFVTPEKFLAAILLVPFHGWQSSNTAMCYCVYQNVRQTTSGSLFSCARIRLVKLTVVSTPRSLRASDRLCTSSRCRRQIWRFQCTVAQRGRLAAASKDLKTHGPN